MDCMRRDIARPGEGQGKDRKALAVWRETVQGCASISSVTAGITVRPGRAAALCNTQAAPLLFLALSFHSQSLLPTFSSGLGWVQVSRAEGGVREEVGLHWLRTCPDGSLSPRHGEASPGLTCR